jgi:Lrp/AsnC family transcriptional regulator, regulator for asnA, asnC and gidA
MPILVDDVDLRLIRCLQDNPRAPYSSIARLTGVSETTVKRRVDALIASGVIMTAVFPNPRRLGYDIQANVGIRTVPTQTHDIALVLREMPEVAFVSVTLGKFDINSYVVTPSMKALTELVTQRMSQIPGVVATETSVSARVYKAFANWRVPLNELQGKNGDIDDEFEFDEQKSRF